MRLSEWRPKLRTFLNSHITINSWRLDAPELNETIGHLPPLRSLSFQQLSPVETHGKGTQEILIARRYPDSLFYDDNNALNRLPVDSLEALWSQVALTFLYKFSELELLDLDVLEVDEPIQISETGDDRGEWLVSLRWAFGLKWLAEAEVDPRDSFTVSDVRGGLYRSRIEDLDIKVLDKIWAVP